MIPLLIKSTLRLLSRNKVLSAVKIIGLAAGSAVFLLTARFCLEEVAYDKQHPDFDRIYRYVHRVNTPEGLQSLAFTSATTGPALKERFAVVTAYCRTFSPKVSVRNPLSDASFNEQRFAFADSNFLDFFHFPLASETPGALNDPLSVLLTPAMAKKYFGDTDPLGKTLVINGEMEFVVKGVFRENFRNTHFNYDFVSSFSSLEVMGNNPRVASQVPASLNLHNKGFAAFYTYLNLAPGSAAGLESKFPSFIEAFRGKGRSERLKPTLQTLASIHLDSHLLYEIDQNGSITVVYVYFFVGLLVLLIACINYVNISTAELINRAKGIGLKKILGVTRLSLTANHLGETAILTALGLAAGAMTVALAAGGFNSMINRNIDFLNLTGLVLLLGIFAVMVVLSGIYPAVMIARSRGLDAFRGSLKTSRGSLVLRNLLVFFQLLISFSLVTVSLLMYGQLDFLLTKDPGFDAEQILTINAAAATTHQRTALKNEFLHVSGVQGVAQCSVPPGESLFTIGLALPENKGEEEKRVLTYQSYVDADFLDVMGVPLTSGRFFDKGNPADSTEYIVMNQAAVDALGEAVLSRTLDIPGMFGAPAKKSVVGVMGNFNFASFHQGIEPLILEYNPGRCAYLLVRFPGASASEVLQPVRKIWSDIVPALPFDYFIMDERFAKFYDGETRQKDLIAGMAILAITLAALGIFGTTLFVVQRRTKEVGIRKMLGSDKADLLLLLIRPAFTLVFLACLAGIPVALFSGGKWLEQYPFRIDISPVSFLAAFGIVLGIVVSTILYHFLKVTRISPVEVLRQGSE